MLCTKSRHLTDGEKQLARSVFGAAIDLERVQICSARWVLEGYAIAPNGVIYFHPADFCADFSCQNLSVRAWFIHELVHIWQYQQGVAVFWRALINRRYRYRLGKPFHRYGLEQQARIVEDFYRRKQQNQDCQAYQACIPFID